MMSRFSSFDMHVVVLAQMQRYPTKISRSNAHQNKLPFWLNTFNYIYRHYFYITQHSHVSVPLNILIKLCTSLLKVIENPNIYRAFQIMKSIFHFNHFPTNFPLFQSGPLLQSIIEKML